MATLTLETGVRRARRIVALGALVLLAVTTMTGWLFLRGDAAQRTALEDRFKARQTTAARFLEAYVADAFERQSTLARDVFDEEMPLQEFADVASDQGFATAVLLDRDGRLQAIHPADPSVVGTLMPDTHLARALNGDPAVSGVFTSVQGPQIVAFAVPFETPAGRRVLGAGYALRETPLEPFIRNATPFRSAEVYLIDESGTVVAANRSQHAGRLFADVRAPIAAVEGGRGRAGAEGHQHFVAQGSVPGTTWRLVFAVDEAELFGPVTHSVTIVLRWLGLAAFFLAGLVSLGLLHRYQLQRARLVESGVRHRAILDTANDAFVGMDEDGRVTDWNLAAQSLFGYSSDRAIGRLVADLIVPPDQREAHRSGTARLQESGHLTAPARPQRLTALHQDGTMVEVEMMLSRVEAESGWRYYAFLRDITERLEHESLLQRLALTDGLTGLANRRAAVDRLEQALAAGTRRGAPVAVVYVDVDKFKAINDRHGHAVGDAILRTVAERLRMTFRLEDTVARMGGDEFVVICENLGTSGDLHALTSRVRRALSQPYLVDGQRFDVTASVGLAVSEGRTTVEHLLDLADAEMYEAKATRQAFAAMVKDI